MKNSFVIAAAIALTAAAWIASGQFSGTQKAAENGAEKTLPPTKETALIRVRVTTSIAQNRRNELVVLGKTEASRRVELKAETSGRIVAIKARKGDQLKKGDVIVQIDLGDRPARLTEAKAKLRQRRLEFQAAKELSARKFRSKVKLAETQALLDTAKANLAKIKLDLSRTVIRAAFDGVLEARPVEIGDVVSIGFAVATIVDLSPMLVVANVPEAQIAKLRSGGIAEARLVTGKKFSGKIRYVSTAAINATRTFEVEMETPNEDHLILAGLTAELRLSLGEVKAHRISPAILTLSDAGLVGVKAVDARNVVEFYPIQLVGETPQGMWLAGLPPRLTIINRGQEYVKVGQTVDPVSAGRTAISELQGK